MDIAVTVAFIGALAVFLIFIGLFWRGSDEPAAADDIREGEPEWMSVAADGDPLRHSQTFVVGSDGQLRPEEH